MEHTLHRAHPEGPPAKHAPVSSAAPEFAGAAGDFPFYFLPYVSQSFGDGSLAHLPWLQELPDVLTSAMWSSWVEINPTTGDHLGIKQGDLVELASPQGTLRAPAILSPGIAPDMVAMPVGQGTKISAASPPAVAPTRFPFSPPSRNTKPVRSPGPRRV